MNKVPINLRIDQPSDREDIRSIKASMSRSGSYLLKLDKPSSKNNQENDSMNSGPSSSRSRAQTENSNKKTSSLIKEALSNPKEEEIVNEEDLIKTARSKTSSMVGSSPNEPIQGLQKATPTDFISSEKTEDPNLANNSMDRYGFEDSDLILCSNSVSRVE